MKPLPAGSRHASGEAVCQRPLREGEDASRRCARCEGAGGDEEARPYYCPRRPRSGHEPTADWQEPADAAGAATPNPPARYRLLEELGRGGMGVVFRAKDEELGREVALKLLPPSADVARRERFLAEARTLASVEDPGVVRLYDSGQTPAGGLWIAMAWVRGPTLAAVLQDVGALPVAEATRIALELAETLGRLHRRGLCHRDIKPANVLLTTQGQPMLTDFGLALQVNERRGPAAEAPIPGTRAYMAPELLSPGSAPDWRRADVFALGWVVAQMLTGESPDGPAGGAAGVGLPPGLLALGRPELAAVVGRAIDPDPTQRFADGAAFAAELERVLKPAPARPGRVRGLRRASAAAAVVAAAVTLIGSAWWTHWRHARASIEREDAAAERLEATWARRASLRAAGNDAEAAVTFEDYVELDENRGTRAWADAWLRLAREQQGEGTPAAAESFGWALVASGTEAGRREAAAGLLGVFREQGSWPEARVLVDQLRADPVLAELLTPDVRLEVALANRDLVSAAAALGSDDPRLPTVERLATMEPVAPGLEVVDDAVCRRPDELSRTSVAGLTLVGTLGYDRGLFRLKGPGCGWAPYEVSGGRDDAWIQGMATLDVDADGAKDLILGLGPPEGYAVQVLRGVGPSTLAAGASRLLGNVEAVGGWTLRSGEPIVLAATSGRHPSRWVFPDAPHRGEVPGLHLLRWTDGALQLVTSFPSPAWNGAPLVPINLVSVDLDQDGDDDELIGAAEWMGVLIQAEPQPPPMWIRGMRLVSLVEAPDAPPRVRVRIDGKDWLLGAGSDRLPPDRSPDPLPAPPPGDEAWARATQLGTMGLFDASADAFSRLGRTRAAAEGVAAWRAAAELRQRTDPLAAAFGLLEAARAGANDAWARAASGFVTYLQAEALRALLAEAPRSQLPAADQATLSTIEGELAQAPPTELDLAASREGWALRAPFARWVAPGGLELRLVTGVGPVARLALERTAGRVGIRLRARISHQEWGSGIDVTLRTEAGTLSAFERRAGDSVAHRREVGLEPAGWFDTPAGKVDAHHEFELIVAPTPGAMNHVVLVPSWDGVRAAPKLVGNLGDFDGAKWTLELASRPEGQLRGPLTELRIESLELWGLRPVAEASPFADASGDAEAVGRLRVSPTAASESLVSERGLPATLALITDAWDEAMVEQAPPGHTRAALLGQLPILRDPEAARAAPILACWRGRLLLDEGRLVEAEAAFRSALPWVGSAGDACFEAHAGLGAVATATGGSPESERAAAAACVGGGLRAERTLALFDARTAAARGP